MNVAVKHVGFGKHLDAFGELGAMEAATGFFHILYFFQLFFTLATGATKLTMCVIQPPSTLNTEGRIS